MKGSDTWLLVLVVGLVVYWLLPKKKGSSTFTESWQVTIPPHTPVAPLPGTNDPFAPAELGFLNFLTQTSAPTIAEQLVAQGGVPEAAYK